MWLGSLCRYSIEKDVPVACNRMVAEDINYCICTSSTVLHATHNCIFSKQTWYYITSR